VSRAALSAAAVGVVLLAGCGGSKSDVGSLPQATAADPVAAGRDVFTSASAGCSGCHTFAAAGAFGTLGPDLVARLRPDAETAGKGLTPFVYQSIVSPNAYVAEGYPRGVMPQDFGDRLSDEQLADLVAFITANV
jgi:mono/diheme cytochrome c family protein